MSKLMLLLALMALTCAPASASQPQANSNQDERIYETSDSGVTLPTVLTEIRPQYTREALDAHIEGTVTVSAVVRQDGTVGEVRVTRSLDKTYGLDEQAVIAARQYRFKAGTKDGKAVAVRVALQFNFTLK